MRTFSNEYANVYLRIENIPRKYPRTETIEVFCMTNFAQSQNLRDIEFETDFSL